MDLLPDTLTSDPVEIVIPQLIVDQQDANRHIAHDPTFRFDLDKLANKSLEAETSYRSLGHYILDRIDQTDLDSKSFDQYSVWNWFILFGVVSAFASLILVLLLASRFRTLSLLLAARTVAADSTTRNIPRIFIFRTSPLPILTNSSILGDISVKQYISQILPIEILTLALLVSLVILIGIAMCYTKWQKNRPQLRLMLMIGNTKNCITLPWTTLELGVEQYKFMVKESVKFALEFKRPGLHCLAQTLTLKITGFSLEFEPLNCVQQLPNTVKLSVFSSRFLQRILTDEYYILLLVQNIHHDILKVIQVRENNFINGALIPPVSLTHIMHEPRTDTNSHTSRDTPVTIPLYPILPEE